MKNRLHSLAPICLIALLGSLAANQASAQTDVITPALTTITVPAGINNPLFTDNITNVIAGYSSTVTLSVSGAPAGVTVVFNGSGTSSTNFTANGTFTGILQVTVSSSAALGTYPLTLAVSGATASGTTTVILDISAQAAPTTATWNNTGAGNDFATPGDWLSGSVPTSGQSLIFNNATGSSISDNLSSLTTVQGINFAAGDGAFTLNAPSATSLLISGAAAGNYLGITNSSTSVQTFASTLNLTLDWGAYNFGSANNGGLALNDTLTLNGGAVAYFNGSGNVSSTTFANDAGNLLPGAVIGIAGAFNAASPVPSITGPASISGGNVITYGYGNAGDQNAIASGTINSGVNDNVLLANTANGTAFALASNPTYINSIATASALQATINTSSHNLVFSKVGEILVDTPVSGNKPLNFTGSGYISAGGNTAGPGTIYVGVNGNSTGNQMNFNNGSIVNNPLGGAVTVVFFGCGSSVMNEAGSYSGGTYVDGGRIQINNAAAFGTGPVYIASGAEVSFQNTASATIANSLFIAPGVGPAFYNGSEGALRLGGNGNNLIFSGNLTLMGAPVDVLAPPGTRIDAQGNGPNTSTFSRVTGTGTLDFQSGNAAGNFFILKNTGTSANDWTGGLIVEDKSGDNCYVKLGAANQINGNNVGLVQAGTAYATLDLAGFSDSIGGLLSAASTFNVVSNSSGTLATLTLAGTNAPGASFGGVIGATGANNIAVTMNGAPGNVQILNGANTYTGATTVSGGTLLLGSGGSLSASSSVSVGVGAFGGTGTVAGNVATTSGSAQINQESNYIATATYGTLPISGNLDMSGGGAGYFDVGGVYTGPNDEVTVGGTLTLGSGTVIHINAQTAGGPLDTTGAYTLIHAVGGIVGGTVSATPVWDGTPPSNSGLFTVLVSGRNVVLAPPIFLVSVATATPSSVTRGQSALLSVVVTNGTPPYAVTVNASSVGGLNPLTLVQDTSQLPASVFTNSTPALAAMYLPGAYTLPVSANDSASGTATANIALTVVGSPLTWVGGLGGNQWDASQAYNNWYNTAALSADTFYNKDLVTFDDSGSISPAVSLSGAVQPGSILMTNDSVNYAFGGSGSITGSTALKVMGAGQVELADSGGDNFSGGILVGNGSLVLSNTAANIAGGITLTNGSLIVAHTGTVAGGLTMNTNASGTVAAVVEGSGTLNGGITAVGNLTVSNNPVIAGGLSVNGGSTYLDQSTTPSGNTTIASGATVQAGNNDALGNLPSGTLLDNGTLTVTRNDSVSISTEVSGPGFIIGSAISGSGALVFNGSGVVAVTNTVGLAFTGTVTVGNGTLAVRGPNNASSIFSAATSLTINNGGTVQIVADNSLGNPTATPGLPIIINAGGFLTGTAAANSGAGNSSHLRGLLTLNGGTLAMAGTESAAHGSWELDSNVLVLASSTTSTITASNVVPGRAGGVIFGVSAGTTPSGIDLLVTGSISNAPSAHDTGMIKMGNGVMELDSGISGFTNFLTISNGVLQVGDVSDAGVLALPLGSATTGGEVTNYATLKFASSQGANVARVITGNGVVVVTSGINTFSGVNTYTGDTIITNTGTLALSGPGTINSSANLFIAPGGTFDVSAYGSYTLGGSVVFNASGTDAGAGAATVKGAPAGIVSLGVQAIKLKFTPTAFAGDTTHPSFVVSQGALTLNNNTFTINNAGGSALNAGTYTVAQVTGGTINQNVTPSYPVTVTGTGLTANMGAYIQVSGGNVNLIVASEVPVVGSPTYYRANGTDLKISITNLMSNASDPAQQPVQLASVDGAALVDQTVIATTGNGSTIYVSSNYNGSAYLILHAINNNNENFQYVVTNTAYPLSASGTINIVVTNAVGVTGSISTVGVGSGSVTTTWAGVVGDDYIIQRNTNMASGAGWVNIWTTNTVPGVFSYTDTFPDIIPGLGSQPPAQAYYRLESAP